MNNYSMLRRGGVLLLAVLLVITGSALAIEKVGTTSIQVLKIPMGVRGIALGNAFSAGVQDAEAVWWNPGALTETKGTQVLLSQINMPADIHLNSLVLARPWGDNAAWSLHAINLYTGDMPERTWDQPLGTGRNFNASDLVIGASYARKLTDRFSLGANVRYLRSSLEDAVYNGASVDLGTLYKTGLRSMRLGMSIQNLGPDVKYSGSYIDYRNRVTNNGDLLSVHYESANLPTMFRLGVAFDAIELIGMEPSKDYAAQFAVDMNHPNDNRERLNIGAEGSFRNQLFLRAGGKFAYDEESFSVGFGLRIPVYDQYRVKFDYAYSHMGRITQATDDFMGQPHRFALGFEW